MPSLGSRSSCSCGGGAQSLQLGHKEVETNINDMFKKFIPFCDSNDVCSKRKSKPSLLNDRLVYDGWQKILGCGEGQRH